MTSYLIQSSICLAGFYGFYRIFLHREKLLSINRFYLLTTSIFALLIPLFDFKYQSETVIPISNIGTKTTTAGETLTGLQNLPLSSLYLIGLVFSLTLFAIRLLKAKKRIGSNFSYQKNPAIIEISENEAYSFFNTIFIGKGLAQNPDLKAQILAHETAHIRGLHFLDLVYFELVKCAFWFNPFSYFYSKAIKLQHEYIADQSALQLTNSQSYEQSLLQFTLSKIDNSLIAGFGQHPIQQRLQMINKLNSNIMKKLKPLFALPVLAILFISFACSEETAAGSDLVPEEVITEVSESPSVIKITQIPISVKLHPSDATAEIQEVVVGVSTKIAEYSANPVEEVVEVITEKIQPRNISNKEGNSSALLIHEEKGSGNE